MKRSRWFRSLSLAVVCLLAVSMTAWALAGFSRPIPGPSPAPSTQHFVAGSTSNAGPGWVWHVFDVSGPRTGEPDLLAYHPPSGTYVLIVTDHYQFSGQNGSVVAPGDCYVSGILRDPVGQPVLNAVLTVDDLDRNGDPDLLAYSPTTGAVTRLYFRSFGGCDWTDAF